MPEPLVIRAAARADVRILLDLIRGLAEYEKLSHLVAADEPLLERELFAPGSNVEAILGFAGGIPVGFAVYFHNFSTFLGRKGLYLEDLFVLPAHRGRGYGRALLRHVARIAHERDCGRFEWMALDWNEPAIRFYKALGAVEMPEWRLFRVTGEALARLGGEAAGNGT
jgi:GNAT superfamily N-acetyltransferase